MPTLRDRQRSRIFRMLGIGDPGTGKTGSLVEVINGMDKLGIKQVVIADFDIGMDILDRVKPELKDRVHFEEFRDKLSIGLEGTKLSADSALSASWARVVSTFTNWPKIGNIQNLKSDSLFVADSLTGLGDCGMNYAQAFIKTNGGDAWRATADAMRFQDKFVQMCIALSCHFIMFSHIRFMGGGGTKVVEDGKGSNYKVEVNSNTEGQAYPSALGKQLPSQIARHFNTMLEYKLVGRNRRIRTVPDLDGRMACKLPLNLGDELPQETGLFTIMDAFINAKE